MANFTALKTAINNAIKTNGNEEITGAVLQVILDAMVETLGDSAINALENALDAEITNRQNAVGGVADDLAAEALARANKDNQLDNRINQEEYNRQNADAALSRTVDQGFQTLGSQMTALNAAISALNAAYQNGYLYGGIATPSSSPADNKCFYIALQAGTYTNFGGVGVVAGINILRYENGWLVEHIYDQTTLLNEFYLLRQQVIRAISSIDPIVIQGDVTNAPDEEDLTSNAQHLLKFKDRAYSPLNFSGLGMKILRKNIAPLSDSAAFNGFVEGVTAEETLAGTPELIFWDRMNTRFVGIKDGVYYVAWTDDDNYVPVSTSLVYMYDGTPYKWDGSNFSVDEDEVPNLVNCLTQDMINEGNTIYIIRYDYTLKEDITIPANCVLQFDGGSISGAYTITGASTIINADLLKIFGTDVTIVGSWHVEEVYPEWFGAKQTSDDTTAIQKAVTASVSMGFKVAFTGGEYNINGTIQVPAYTQIYGKIKHHWNTPVCVIIQHSQAAAFGLKGNGISISGFKLINYANLNDSCIGICILNTDDTNIERIDNKLSLLHIEGFYYGIYAKTTTANAGLGYFGLSDSLLLFNVYGVYVSLATGGWMNYARFDRVHFQVNTRGGAFIETSQTEDIVFDNCCLEGNGTKNTDTYEGYGIKIPLGSISVINSYFEVNYSKKVQGENIDLTDANQLQSANIIVSQESVLNVENCLINYEFHNIVHLGYTGAVYTKGNKIYTRNEYNGFVTLANAFNITPILYVSINESCQNQNCTPIIYPSCASGSRSYEYSSYDVHFTYTLNTESIHYITNNGHFVSEPILYIGTPRANDKDYAFDKNHPVGYVNSALNYPKDNKCRFRVLADTSIGFWSETDVINKDFEFVAIENKKLNCDANALYLLKGVNTALKFENIDFIINDTGNTMFFSSNSKNNKLEFYNCTFKLVNNVELYFHDLSLLSFYNCTFADGNAGHFAKNATTVKEFVNVGGDITF